MGDVATLRVAYLWEVCGMSKLAVVVVTLIVFVTMAGVTGCAEKKQAEPPSDPGKTMSLKPEPPTAAEAPGGETTAQPKGDDKTIIKITTPKGVITAEIYDKVVPITAGSFLASVQDGFYDGLTFHRIEPGFCAQGGDPKGDGSGGPGFTIPDEVTQELKHDVGMLSMAKTDMPDSGGSQFFICLGGPEVTGHLDMKHSVFGKVIDGMAVAEKLEKGDKMEKVEITSKSSGFAAAIEKGKAARKPE